MSSATAGVAAGILAGVVGPPLIWSGTLKLRDPRAAALALVRFRISRSSRPGLARLVAIAELTAGLGVLLSGGFPLAFVSAAILFAGFAALTARAYTQHAPFACACFGSSSMVSRWTVVRAIGLLLMAATGALLDGGVGSPRSVLIPTALGAIFLALGLSVAALIRTRPYSSTISTSVEAS